MPELQQITRYNSIPKDLDNLPACFELTVPTHFTQKILSIERTKLRGELREYRIFAETLIQPKYGYKVTERIQDYWIYFWRFEKTNVVTGFTEGE